MRESFKIIFTLCCLIYHQSECMEATEENAITTIIVGDRPDSLLSIYHGKARPRIRRAPKHLARVNQYSDLVKSRVATSELNEVTKWVLMIALLCDLFRPAPGAKIQSSHIFSAIVAWLQNHLNAASQHCNSPYMLTFCYELVAQLAQSNSLSILFVSLAGVRPIPASGTSLKFQASVELNRRKPTCSRVTGNIYLGKMPQLSHFDQHGEYFCRPKLVVSVVDPSEFLTGLSLHDRGEQFAWPTKWLSMKTNQILLASFIDFGRPYRNNPSFQSYHNPLDAHGQKFQDQSEWDHYLDHLYEEVYRACCLIKKYDDNNDGVYLHCKAGKGRSVMVAATYLALIQNINSLEGLNDVWQQILDVREHVDKDDASKLAVWDCVCFIREKFGADLSQYEVASQYFAHGDRRPSAIARPSSAAALLPG